MIQRQFLHKIFLTVFIMFIILTISTIPVVLKDKQHVLRTNLELKDITTLPSNSIFLLNKNNLLVKTNIIIEDKKNIVPEIIDYLKEANNDIPQSLNGYLPKKTKLLNYTQKEDILILDFSKELLTTSKEKNNIIITGIVYSMLEIDSIKKVSITIEKEELQDYPSILDKSIGINKDFELTGRNDIKKVVIFYLDQKDYYVPITKYVNDKREKVEIIIEELKNTNNFEWISPLNIHTNLLEYREEANVLYLNFNKYLLDKNKEENKKILNTISYSIFENYDVNMVMFEVENKEIEYIKKP